MDTDLMTATVETAPESVPLNTQVPETQKPERELKPAHYYAQRITSHLPKEIFKPYGWRVALAATYMLIAGGALYFVSTPVEWYFKVAASVLVGMCIGGLGFFAHEVLHGSVVRNRTLQEILAFVAFTPWLITPTFWKYWHNQLHHGKTQSLISDPDAFPTMKIFKLTKYIQAMFPFTPGSGHKRSYSYFFFWFSFHVMVAQTYLRTRNSLYDRLNHRRVMIELVAMIAIWGTALYLLGPQNLVYTFVIPFLVQNYFVMSYISTNHNLSPLTRVNDPLANSLTVTNHPILEKLHLGFGYHVEHHLLPNVNGVHGRKIHEVLKREFPNEYIYMPKGKAMAMLYKTARIYKNSTTLIHPHTGATYDTLTKENASL